MTAIWLKVYGSSTEDGTLYFVNELNQIFLFQYRNKTKGRYIPWHDDYDTISEAQLEKYMDKEIFADYLERVEDEREAKREERRKREKKMV